MYHVLLLQKLNMLGFEICLIDCVQVLPQKLFIGVSVAGILCVEVAITSGVPQGSVYRTRINYDLCELYS